MQVTGVFTRNNAKLTETRPKTNSYIDYFGEKDYLTDFTKKCPTDVQN